MEGVGSGRQGGHIGTHPWMQVVPAVSPVGGRRRGGEGVEDVVQVPYVSGRGREEVGEARWTFRPLGPGNGAMGRGSVAW